MALSSVNYNGSKRGGIRHNIHNTLAFMTIAWTICRQFCIRHQKSKIDSQKHSWLICAMKRSSRSDYIVQIQLIGKSNFQFSIGHTHTYHIKRLGAQPIIDCKHSNFIPNRFLWRKKNVILIKWYQFWCAADRCGNIIIIIKHQSLPRARSAARLRDSNEGHSTRRRKLNWINNNSYNKT